jgi:hypothetical protein
MQILANFKKFFCDAWKEPYIHESQKPVFTPRGIIFLVELPDALQALPCEGAFGCEEMLMYGIDLVIAIAGIFLEPFRWIIEDGDWPGSAPDSLMIHQQGKKNPVEAELYHGLMPQDDQLLAGSGPVRGDNEFFKKHLQAAVI